MYAARITSSTEWADSPADLLSSLRTTFVIGYLVDHPECRLHVHGKNVRSSRIDDHLPP
jgi:hypothetical protein